MYNEVKAMSFIVWWTKEEIGYPFISLYNCFSVVLKHKSHKAVVNL